MPRTRAAFAHIGNDSALASRAIQDRCDVTDGRRAQLSSPRLRYENEGSPVNARSAVEKLHAYSVFRKAISAAYSADFSLSPNAWPAALAPVLTDSQIELLHPAAREGYEKEVTTRPPAPPRAPQTPMVPQLVLAFARAGGRIVLGSDAGCCSYAHFAGVADHQALVRLVDFGFTPLETIRIATSDGARFLGIDGRTGSIAAGEEADLQVVRGAPDQDIRDIDKIEMVFANGIAYDPATLLSSVKGQVGWR